MSKYMSFDAEAFPNRELLVEALKEIGFENVTVGTAYFADDERIFCFMLK